MSSNLIAGSTGTDRTARGSERVKNAGKDAREPPTRIAPRRGCPAGDPAMSALQARKRRQDEQREI
jgi:hypothetical protein